MCCVDVRSVLAHCPSIQAPSVRPPPAPQAFCGLGLRGAAGRLKTEASVRCLLHRDYKARGGEATLARWARTRWDKRKLENLGLHGMPSSMMS
jgi:hypothetical protein